MEIGTTIISTQEYMELRAMKDNLEARKAEIEANADKLITGYRDDWGYFKKTAKYTGKDEALIMLSEELKEEREEKEKLRIELERRTRERVAVTLPARLRFLFTGNLTKVKE